MTLQRTDPRGPTGLERVRRDDLERALRHHRRALDALTGTTFRELPPRTCASLQQRLQAELDAIDAELQRRGMPSALHLVPSPA